MGEKFLELGKLLAAEDARAKLFLFNMGSFLWEEMFCL